MSDTGDGRLRVRNGSSGRKKALVTQSQSHAAKNELKRE